MGRMTFLDQKSREKVALAVFSALIVFILVAVILYLNVGHSWNVAATSLDDTLGNMDGYTVILYEGTVDPEAEIEEEDEEEAETEAEAAADLASGEDGEDALSLSGDLFPEADADSEGSDEDEEEDAAAPLDLGLDEPEPISVEEVEESYEEKGAEVLELDVTDPALYEEGLILKCGSKRYGVFSVDMYSLEHDVEAQIERFEDYAVDFVVVITPDANLVDDIPGIDIAISTADEGLSAMGSSSGGTFFVDSPELGKVGVVAISPSEVVSAKVIDEL